MNALRNILFLLPALALGLSSCEDPIDFQLDDSPERVVIYGLLTQVDTLQYVEVSRTIPYTSTDAYPFVEDATVSVTGTDGSDVSFAYNAAKNRYEPAAAFSPSPGHTFTLSVSVDGETYTAVDSMKAVGTINNMFAYRFPEGVREDEFSQEDLDFGRFHRVYADADDLPEQRDFYMFATLRNDTLQNFGGSFVNIGDDEFINSEIRNIELIGSYAEGEDCTLSIFGLSRTVYLYWQDFNNNIGNDGGFFSPPPANPRSNIEGGAIGIWQASSYASMTITLDESTIVTELPDFER